ncbi:uncharacterized protein ACA1_115190 [Acanthamoeba castellanii str. Neff]|uniref:Uncharacterized protein n=1 Tax=Acanthamoeba castellanii (strain ATCC 30010 / Neff) TaxID=1257118 RepID=L8H3Q9_ACACF|nr:uncharacterized protein ACA1_115190 [Acanthamoeba castellanii str. Neff]ELR20109.1 hypothetical protein ACA1_115190 [Acanthamoeba castellanii str. Neff]
MVQALGFSLPHSEAPGGTADEALPRVLNVYQLGSRVYQTAEPGSDWDFLFLVCTLAALLHVVVSWT